MKRGKKQKEMKNEKKGGKKKTKSAKPTDTEERPFTSQSPKKEGKGGKPTGKTVLRGGKTKQNDYRQKK